MAAKPKLTPEQWASTRATWEADPRKPLAWLIEELGLPVGAEALRLRAKSEGWAKRAGMLGKGSAKLAKPKLAEAKPKLGKSPKPKLAPENPRLDDDGFDLVDSPAPLLKPERENESTLTPKEERFVGEYLIDLNATQAAIRAGYSAKSARQIGTENLSKPSISAAIAIAQDERAKRTGISADKALLDVWHMASADARELSQVKVDCCRFCHGEGHQRQRTVGEMNRDREKHVAKKKDITDFDEEGGIGFDPLRPPHKDCPECGGDGHARPVVMDTRYLSPQAAALYAGAKQGKYGVEVQTHSKMAAMDMVFRHLGLYEKDNGQKALVIVSNEHLDSIYAEKMDEGRAKSLNARSRMERLGFAPDKS